jgi:hypothetical protein
MERKEVKTKLSSIKKAIKEIEENENFSSYITKDKYLPGAGYIHEIDSIAELIKAHKEIKNKSNNDFTDSIKELGLLEDEVPESKTRILGFKPEHWLKDIETRLSELSVSIRLTKLKDAEKALAKHLSDDDKFEMDTDGIDKLLL